MNNEHKARATDLELLGQLKAFSWLSSQDKSQLLSALQTANFVKHDVIVRESELASSAHILLAGAASITCLNVRTERVMVALLAPGPVPDFPTLPFTPSRFQIEAYDDCRVGSLSWEQFDHITAHSSPSAFRKFHQNNFQQWYRLLLRGSSFLSLGLHERVGLALLELCSDFGIDDSRGMLIRVAVSHRHLANLVGASRPRVTEHLARLEHDGLVIRQGRQLVVRADELRESMNVRPLDLPIKMPKPKVDLHAHAMNIDRKPAVAMKRMHSLQFQRSTKPITPHPSLVKRRSSSSNHTRRQDHCSSTLRKL